MPDPNKYRDANANFVVHHNFNGDHHADANAVQYAFSHQYWAYSNPNGHDNSNSNTDGDQDINSDQHSHGAKQLRPARQPSVLLEAG